ncbi:hypothetical protein M405DRAFT_171403 [Rhizopogon salebrosus TDB-379]|nr:hypothetical protein M405DRAFT_171403 [Rhizopogon salebrosus TDB-379]
MIPLHHLRKRNQSSNGEICHQPFLVMVASASEGRKTMTTVKVPTWTMILRMKQLTMSLKMNDNSDLDGTTDPEDIAEDGSNKADFFNGEAFDAASIINFNSRKLADVLADKDLATLSRSTKEYHNSSTGKRFPGREGLN